MSDEDRDDKDPLQSLIAEILEAESRGDKIDRHALINQHVEYADSLRGFFADHDRMKSAADVDPPTLPPRSGGPASEDPTIAPGASSLDDPTLLPTEPGGDDPTLPPTEGASRTDEPTVGDKVRYFGDKVRYFGDYELLEEIARGGMGVVYKARQMNLNRTVALKMILSGQFAGEEDVQRFYTEAEVAASLDHPGIVPIFEIGEHAGQHYFSMGYVEGESLAQKVADGPLPSREAAELVKKICDAMAYAHERGVIHRDLKPANILIDPNRQPKVTDFGLAKKTEADSNLTGTGQILGTPAYMPPEQAAGKTEDVGPLADVYSLGAILYCLLTGRPPFQAASRMDTLLQVLDQEPVAPRTLNAQVPVDLETICLKCLSKESKKRYATAADLGAEISRYLRGEPILARPVGQAERTWRWCKRNPALSAASGTAGLLVLSIAIAGPIVAYNQAQLRGLADANAADAFEEKSRADAKAEEVQERLWGSLVQQSRAERLAGRRWSSMDAIREAASMKQSSVLRKEAFQTVASFGVHKLQSLPFGKIERLAFNADGSMLAAAGSYHFAPNRDPSKVGSVVVWEVPSARRVGISPRGRYVQSFSFRPNAPQLLVPSDDGQQTLWDPFSGAIHASFGKFKTTSRLGDPDAGTGGFPSGRFSGDGRLVATTTDHDLLVWDTENGTVVARHTAADPIAFLSSDVLLLERERRLLRWNIVSGEETTDVVGGRRVLDVSPTGRVVVHDKNALSIWDSVSDSEIATLSGFDGTPHNVRFGRDGELLAIQTSNDRNELRIWDSKSKSFKSRITGWTGRTRDEIRFSPDGTLLTGPAGNGTLKIWNVETGEPLHTLREDSLATWRGDATMLATIGGGWIDTGDGSRSNGPDTVVNVWEVANPTPTYVDTSSLGPIRWIRFSRNGKQLATDRTLWDVVEGFQGSRIQASASVLHNFFLSANGAAWEFHTKRIDNGSRVPGTQLKLSQLMPQSRDLELTVSGQVTVKEFCPNGKFLAVATDISEFEFEGPGRKRIIKWYFALELHDLVTNKQVWRRTFRAEEPIKCISLSDDSTLIAIGRANAGTELLDVATGDKLFEDGFVNGVSSQPNSPECVVFNPSGSVVFTGESDSGLIIVGDVKTGRNLGVWTGHTGSVLSLAVDPTGELLASAGDDHTIQLWDVPTGRRLDSWEAHDSDITSLSFSPDGATLVSGGADSTLKLWNLSFIKRELSALGL